MSELDPHQGGGGVPFAFAVVSAVKLRVADRAAAIVRARDAGLGGP